MNITTRSKNNSARLCGEYNDGNRNFHRGEVFKVLGYDGFLVQLVRGSYRITVPRGCIQIIT